MEVQNILEACGSEFIEEDWRPRRKKARWS
jgi:hypothetical protein